MDTLKKLCLLLVTVALYVATFLFLLLTVVSFPSIGSVLFLIGAVVVVPVKWLQSMLKERGIKLPAKIIIAIVALIAGSFLTPQENLDRWDKDETPRAEDHIERYDEEQPDQIEQGTGEQTEPRSAGASEQSEPEAGEQTELHSAGASEQSEPEAGEEIEPRSAGSLEQTELEVGAQTDLDDAAKLDQTELEADEPTSEPEPELSGHDKIDADIRAIIEEHCYDTDIDGITLNENYGTEIAGDYVALIHLTWNAPNSAKTTKKMIAMYSEDLAARIGQSIPDVTDVAIFWIIPYHLKNSNAAKYSYERRNGGMYQTDVFWSNAVGGSEENSGKLSFDACVAILKSSLLQSYGNDCSVDVKDNIITISAWRDGVAVGAASAASGDRTALAAWDGLKQSMISMTENTQNQFAENGHDVIVVANVLNDMNRDNTLLSVMAGVVIYDAVNG